MTNSPKISIAIADDHPAMRHGIASFLKQDDKFDVTVEAADGHELIQTFSTALKLPDVCILDISMPKLDGFETMKIIGKKWPTVKVLTFSMFETELSILRMLRYGSVGYISKTTDLPVLSTAINEIHTRGFYYSDLMLETVNLKSTKNTLNDRELCFLSYCCSELSYKEIAAKMNLSKRTVEDYSATLFEKLNVKTRIGLTMYALAAGIGFFTPENKSSEALRRSQANFAGHITR